MADEQPLNWNDLANTRVGEVEPPKGIPDGHYSCIITGQGKAEPKGKKKNLVLAFPVRLNEPLEDVDSEDFANSDGFRNSGYELQFWLTPASLYRFTEFGKAMGGSEDMSVQDLAEYLASCGNEFVVEVSNNPSEKDPTRTYLNLDNPQTLEAYQAANA